MENASKALLIAGSVLIVILLIAFGMRIFNSTSGTTDNLKGAMATTEIAQFNSKFTAYAGTGKSVAQVRSLANVVIAHNATNPDRVVYFDGLDTAADIMDYVVTFVNRCDVSVDDTDGNGLIDNIYITENS